jgi:uracil-DNA glycosylase family 4
MVASKLKFHSVSEIDQAIISCKKCPRLVDWRKQVAIEKRKAYKDQEYWGKAVPSFGSANPKILVLGLAPGAHGANRTGRIFTGDSSGDWLFRSLHTAGLAKLSTSISKTDGQKLEKVRIACAVRCAPPDNKPNKEEEINCSIYLKEELNLLSKNIKVIVVLGNFAYSALLKQLKELDYYLPTPKIKFGHGQELTVVSPNNREIKVICSFHPSQQNTFTGKLTESMLDGIFNRAKALI